MSEIVFVILAMCVILTSRFPLTYILRLSRALDLADKGKNKEWDFSYLNNVVMAKRELRWYMFGAGAAAGLSLGVIHWLHGMFVQGVIPDDNAIMFSSLLIALTIHHFYTFDCDPLWLRTWVDRMTLRQAEEKQ